MSGARLVDPRSVETLDVLGPTIQFLTNPAEDAPCVMRGTIPPGGAVPLHSHPDPETFLMVSGELEGLVFSDVGPGWVRLGPGDVFHVPGGERHAWRNRFSQPAVSIVVSTASLGRFLREVAAPIAPGSVLPGPPSEEALERFAAAAARYGHWLATPAENAAVGLALEDVR